jgi:hypothetical protein
MKSYTTELGFRLFRVTMPRTSDRQLDRQLFEERMPVWKLQPEFQNNRQIPTGAQTLRPTR